LKERLRTDAEALAKVAVDESGLPPGRAGAVVFPKNTAEVARIAAEASALGIAVVPRGAGTGKSGAAMPQNGELVVDLSQMNRLLALMPHDQYAVVEPGLITGDFHQAVAEVGYFYPPDPGSWESCTLGGNIATNAGGPRAVKYGVTQRYVWGLQIVTMRGDVLRFGRRSIKGVAGLDLTSLLVGSEGTLGIITEATLHIVPAPEAVETAWFSFADLFAASRAGEALFAAGLVPRMMELLDQAALDTVRKVAPFRIPEPAGAALLIEMDGSPARATADLERAAEIILAAGASDSALAKNEKEREAMRRTRRLVSSALKEAYPFKMSDDIAVPRSQMVPLLEQAKAAGASTAHLVCAYGHLGDGNLHMNLLARSAEERQHAGPLRHRIVELAVSLGGTISGEHGLGLTKRELLPLEQTTSVIALQRQIKQVFDPQGLLNPGKVWPDV